MGIYSSSLFLNGGKVGVREIAFGIIIGGITNGAGATYIENIGASLAIGFFGGFFGGIIISLSAIRTAISDSLGYIISVIVACFLGGFVMFPIVILRHYILSQE